MTSSDQNRQLERKDNIDGSSICFIACESVYPHYIGTGFCIDQNNNEACNYDGGDCCLPDGNTDFCTLCICHEHCDAPLELIGNGVCNDEANNVDCKYDGGDCCGACINTEQCTECVCHEEGKPALDLSCK